MLSPSGPIDWIIAVIIIWGVRLCDDGRTRSRDMEGGVVDDTSDGEQDSSDDDKANCSGNREGDNALSSGSTASTKR